MRYPATHTFLKWFGPSVIAFVGGSVGLIAALAQGFPRVQAWAERNFDEWWPIVSAPWFLAVGVAAIAAYIWALIYTGRKTIDNNGGGRATRYGGTFLLRSRWQKDRREDGDHMESATRAKTEANAASSYSAAWADIETNRVPFTRIRHVAHEFGIDLEDRNSVGANNADKIEGRMRQAAVDDELKVWGRKYRGPVKHNDPLVSIDPSHFENYGFRHGCLHYEGPNEQTATGTIQTAINHPDGIEGVTYYDLQISYDDMRRILKQFSESEDNEQA
ncbi:MAG: hypothetical protein AAFW97_00025 [Pseudomonadota bacterium]